MRCYPCLPCFPTNGVNHGVQVSGCASRSRECGRSAEPPSFAARVASRTERGFTWEKSIGRSETVLDAPSQLRAIRRRGGPLRSARRGGQVGRGCHVAFLAAGAIPSRDGVPPRLVRGGEERVLQLLRRRGRERLDRWSESREATLASTCCRPSHSNSSSTRRGTSSGRTRSTSSTLASRTTGRWWTNRSSRARRRSRGGSPRRTT